MTTFITLVHSAKKIYDADRVGMYYYNRLNARHICRVRDKNAS